MSRRPDTRAIGLDVGLSFIRWLTGAENLHYGLWTGLEVSAGNLRAAQDAYTARLFAHLPGRGPLRILDIGGGAGETARKLVALGHEVDIVVPSAFLAARCRANVPSARVHEMTFEAFRETRRFDLCLFSESFQYILLDRGLPGALDLLAPGGEVLIADCFRTEAYKGRAVHGPKPGGGHRLAEFRSLLGSLPVDVLAEEDLTDAVAPSIDVEQGLFNVLGHALTRVDADLRARRPVLRRILGAGLGLVQSRKRRERLMDRLTGTTRTSEAFRTYNRYLLLRIRRRD